MIADILFLMFAGLLMLAALGVVFARNPMFCVMFLIFAFFNAAGLFLLLGAEFLALLLVMVYVGAVAVMFLFVLMTINITFDTLKEGFATYLPSGLLLAGVVLAEAVAAYTTGVFSAENFNHVPLLPAAEGTQNITALGRVLFTHYLLPFQAAGVVLLTAMVGAIVLTHRKRPDAKRQNILRQINRKREDAVELVKIKPGQGL